MEYFFFTFGASFLLKIHYQMKTLQLSLKAFTFFKKKGRVTENKTGFRCSVLLAKNIYKAWKVKENFVAFFYSLKQSREQYE